MIVNVYDRLERNIDIKFVVIIGIYNNKWVLVKHKERNTWEFPGGHCEKNETTKETAKRELFEETGANKFVLESIGFYSVENSKDKSFGELFFANISNFNNIPENFEMERREFFDKIPKNLTYPSIYPILIDKINDYIDKKHNN